MYNYTEMTFNNVKPAIMGMISFDDCKKTCLEQTFAYHYEPVYLVVFAFICLVVYFFILKEYFPIVKYVDTDTTFIIMNLSLRLAMYSLMIFFIWLVILAP